MLVKYKTKKLEKACNNFSLASKIYGYNIAIKLHTRIDQLIAALSIEELLRYRIGRCHALTGNRSGQYAMDLAHPYRLIFEVNIYGDIQVSEVIKIIDHH